MQKADRHIQSMTLQRHLNKSSHVQKAAEHIIMNKTVSFLKNEEIKKINIL